MQEVMIDDIRIDGQTQPRAEIDAGIVEEYAERMDAGDTFPPAEAVFDGSAYWLWDGFHRYHGACKVGRPTLACNVREGTVEDARWLCLAANKAHGNRRTNVDKRRAAEMALCQRPDLSDHAVAEHLGVSHPFIGKVRAEVYLTGNDYQSNNKRTGKDGRTINTANIGMPRVQTELPLVPEKPILSNYITLPRWEEMTPKEQQKALATVGMAKFNDQGDNENIEWALWSWNPVTGCKHDCPYCYARDIAERFYAQKFEPSVWPGRLAAPLNTTFPEHKITEELAKGTIEGNARAMGLGNVFVCSMADLFGRWVPREWIDAVLNEVRAAPQWNFLFLSKFPIRMAEFEFPDNAWVGTTVDCQARVANAEKAFRQVRAAVKWLSCEPLIEPLKFQDLGAFQWVVIGGASKSSQTPEWKPPREWVNSIEAAAVKAGCKVYEKTNLLERIKQYPGVENAPPKQAPEQLRYLPSVEPP